MLTETVISAVFERRALWDPAHPQHKNATVLKRLWVDVGKELNASEKLARNKWKNARDYYRRELKKMEARGPSEELVSSTWPYFQQMAFLKNVLTPEARFANLPLEIVDGEDVKGKDCEVRFPVPPWLPSPPDKSNNSSSEAVTSQDSSEERIKRLRKSQERASKGTDDVTAGKRKQELQEGKEDSEDDDLHFFKSLLPYMKKMSDTKKLRLRAQILDLLLLQENDQLEN
ncbi:uncharacterized protein LOC125026523 [Penaeus chinensis]|uniref:uncharacterized protein LOC125026523 n=1 Tax=Penaeus chinensis TaxID=139456 RepID=UPI001FB807CE|nr:uncharacterized protein LOC125026523 [Penaeus chinensis]